MRSYIYAPGPTPVPPHVTLKMSEPILNHRSPEYVRLFEEVTEHLKYVFQTAHDVLTFTASGTGAMEAAVANLLSPGDRAVVIRAGKFGGRWAELCAAYGVEAVPIDVEWGHAVDPSVVADVLSRESGIKAVFATHSETSTGVLHDIETLGRVVSGRDVLFVVDAISGLGANDLRPDDWHVDVVVSGSQKGLMLPPGLAFASVGPRAWAASDRATSPRYYLSFKRAKEALKKGLNPYTPAITLIMGLAEALRQIKAEGLANVFARHARLAEATRAGVRAIGLELFATRPSNVLTSVTLPAGIDGNQLLKHLKARYGIIMGGGLDHLKGKIVRIAHLGYADEFHAVVGISALEMGLAYLGYQFKVGVGVAAVQRVLTFERSNV
ncbi:MAG: alanine--glyoxylate aminotransferase family protein [Candidatus Latescibacteria bacterium]|nr:alanine--glyoxylate aminotransferase family protein [Candidatus Latescibacterota bacterium]